MAKWIFNGVLYLAVALFTYLSGDPERGMFLWIVPLLLGIAIGAAALISMWSDGSFRERFGIAVGYCLPTAAGLYLGGYWVELLTSL